MATTAESYYGITAGSRTEWSAATKKRLGYSKLSETDWARMQGYNVQPGEELISTRDSPTGIAVEGSGRVVDFSREGSSREPLVSTREGIQTQREVMEGGLTSNPLDVALSRVQNKPVYQIRAERFAGQSVGRSGTTGLYGEQLERLISEYETKEKEIEGMPFDEAAEQYPELNALAERINTGVSVYNWAAPLEAKLEQKKAEESEFSLFSKDMSASWKESRQPGFYEVEGGEYRFFEEPTTVFHGVSKEQAAGMPFIGMDSLTKYAAGGYGKQTGLEALDVFTSGLFEKSIGSSRQFYLSGFDALEKSIGYEKNPRGPPPKISESLIRMTYDVGKEVPYWVATLPAQHIAIPMTIGTKLAAFTEKHGMASPLVALAVAPSVIESQARGMLSEPVATGVLLGAWKLGGKPYEAVKADAWARFSSSPSRVAALTKVQKTPARVFNPVITEVKARSGKVLEPISSRLEPVSFEFGRLKSNYVADWRTESYKWDVASDRLVSNYFIKPVETAKIMWLESGAAKAWSEYPPVKAYKGYQDFMRPPKGAEWKHLKQGIEAEILNTRPNRVERTLATIENFRLKPYKRYVERHPPTTPRVDKPFIDTSTDVTQWTKDFYIGVQQKKVPSESFMEFDLRVGDLSQYKQPKAKPTAKPSGYSNIPNLGIQWPEALEPKIKQAPWEQIDVKDMALSNDFGIPGGNKNTPLSAWLNELYNVPPLQSKLRQPSPKFTSDFFTIGDLSEIKAPKKTMLETYGREQYFNVAGTSLQHSRTLLKRGVEVIDVSRIEPMQQIAIKPRTFSSMLADQRGAITLQDTRQKPWFLKKQPEKTITEEQYLMYLKTKPRHLITPGEYDYLYGTAGAGSLTLHPSMRENVLATKLPASAEYDIRFETTIQPGWSGRGSKDFSGSMFKNWRGTGFGGIEALQPGYDLITEPRLRQDWSRPPGKTSKPRREELFKPGRFNITPPESGELTDVFTGQKRSSKQLTAVLTIPKPFTTTLQKTKTIIKTRTKTKKKIKDITPLPKPKQLLLLRGTRYPSSNLSKLFSVQVRRKGKWTPVATLPKKAATQLGIDITETTAARSFRLAPTGIEAEAKDIPFVIGMERYRKPKARSTLGFDTWVEKTKYAISTPGEKREITLKGLSMRPMRLRVKK